MALCRARVAGGAGGGGRLLRSRVLRNVGGRRGRAASCFRADRPPAGVPLRASRWFRASPSAAAPRHGAAPSYPARPRASASSRPAPQEKHASRGPALRHRAKRAAKGAQGHWHWNTASSQRLPPADTASGAAGGRGGRAPRHGAAIVVPAASCRPLWAQTGDGPLAICVLHRTSAPQRHQRTTGTALGLLSCPLEGRRCPRPGCCWALPARNRGGPQCMPPPGASVLRGRGRSGPRPGRRLHRSPRPRWGGGARPAQAQRAQDTSPLPPAADGDRHGPGRHGRLRVRGMERARQPLALHVEREQALR
jgi:hypothetical protein